MAFEVLFFGVAVALAAVIAWLYITGGLESALDAFTTPRPEPSEQERAAARARIDRKVTKCFELLERLVKRPAIRRLAQSKVFTALIIPALTALFLVGNGCMIVASFLGVFHWFSGFLSFVFILFYLGLRAAKEKIKADD